MIVELAVAGLILSAYALHVERNAKKKSYKAMCDIHENVSCTRAFTSPYGRTLGTHNAWYGIAFYIIVLLAVNQPYLLWYLAIAATLRSVHLAYISYVKMYNFCLVCTATYLVNFALLYYTWPIAF